MPYEITATRKRPTTFDELAGQEFVQATLKNSVSGGKIAHAYLFSGPRGCGKTSTARILAKALNCEKGESAEPCGSCSSCQAIARGQAMDVIEIDGASNTSVDNIRQIKDEVLFPPNSSRYKIYIIDEVHMLSNSAFNALLKTIEEPPPYIVFIFATTELHKVPATVKSRCQHFNFRLVPIPVIRGLLKQAADELSVGAEDEALFWIAKESTGSVRDAYTLFDQVVAFSGTEITMTGIKEKLALVGIDDLNLISEACIAGASATAFSLLDDVLGQGVSIDQLTMDFCDFFRAIMLIKQGVTKDTILGYPLSRYSPRVIDSLTPSQAERSLSLFLELFRNLRYSVDPRFEMELAVSRLSSMTKFLSPGDIGAEILSLKKALASGNTVGFHGSGKKTMQGTAEPSPAPLSEPPENPSGLANPDTVPPQMQSDQDSLSVVQALKLAVIQKLRKTRAMIAANLEKTKEWEMADDRLIIPFRAHYEAEFVRQDINSISTIVQSLTGKNFRVELKSDPALKKPDPQPESEDPDNDVDFATDPVKIVESVFRGTKISDQPIGGEQ